MGKSFDVRVPVELLLSTLPKSAKLVWISVRSFQGQGEYCRASGESIGKRCITETGQPTDKARVSKAIKLLIDTGWIEDHGRLKLRAIVPRNHNCEVDVRSTNTNGESRREVNLKLTPGQPKVDARSTRTENKLLKPKVKQTARAREDKKTPSRKQFKAPTAKQVRDCMEEYAKTKEVAFDYDDQAEAFILHFNGNGWKVSGKAPMKDWESAAQGWARRHIKGEFSRNGTSDVRAKYKPRQPKIQDLPDHLLNSNRL